jgi:hypothetical protein
VHNRVQISDSHSCCYRSRTRKPSSGAGSNVAPRIAIAVARLPHPAYLLTIQNLKEIQHVWQCNARSPKSELQHTFPSFTFPAGMAEDEINWRLGSDELLKMMPVPLPEGILLDKEVIFPLSRADYGVGGRDCD